MATTTPNFGWPVPTSTDLVKDGATAIESLGDSIDASLLDLKGGTSGQVLSKNSNTDMDFTWVTSDDANAIQNAIVDAKGDLIAATAADTPARLAVGTNGQILTADSTAATGLAWATPSAGAIGLTYITGGTFTNASTIALSAGALTSTYKNYVVVFNVTANSGGQNLLLQLNEGGTPKSSSNYYGATQFIGFSTDTTIRSNGANSFRFGATYDSTYANIGATFEIYNCGSSTKTGFAGTGQLFAAPSDQISATNFGGYFNTNMTCDGFTITTSTGNVTGFYRVYGRNQS